MALDTGNDQLTGMRRFGGAARDGIVWSVAHLSERIGAAVFHFRSRAFPRLRTTTAWAVQRKIPLGIACSAVLGLAIAAQGYLLFPPDPMSDGVISGEELSAVSADRARRGFGMPRGVTVVSASAGKLFKDFRRIGYRLEEVRNGGGPVPRVFVKSLPKDIGDLDSIATRKAVFIKTLLPLVLHINEELRTIRARILTLTAQIAEARPLAPADQDWLSAQYGRFGVSEGDMARLLLRVDVIPPSLAVAQAAEESGWGTSRFALEGRALFGQRTYKTAAGLAPLGRPDGTRFRVKTFTRLMDAVRSYIRNLNTHSAYRRFRVLRGRAREQGGRLDPFELAEGLTSYSERGGDYVNSIKTIIRVNRLTGLDGARLSINLDRARELAPA